MGGRLYLTLFLLALADAVPVWLVSYPPLVDYPNHLAGSYLEAHLDDEASVLRNDFGLVWRPYPNLGMDMIVQPLQAFLPIAVAGKASLTVLLTLLPLSTVFLCASVRREQWWIGLAGFLMTYDAYFLLGFVSFSLGMVLCFFVLGLWIRWREKLSARRTAAMASLFLLAFLTHLHAFLTLAVSLLVHEVASGLTRERLFRFGAIMAPAAFVAAVWLHSSDVLPRLATQHNGVEDSFAARARDLLSPVLAYSKWLGVATALALVLLAASWVRRPFIASRGLASAFVILFALYWLLPNAALTSHGASARLAFILCVLGLAMLRLEPRAPRLALALLIVLCFLRLVDVTARFRTHDRELRRYAASFEDFPRGARVCPIVFKPQGKPLRDFPEAHFLCEAVIERQIFCPTVFAIPAQMPLRLRATPDVPAFYVDGMAPPDWSELLARYDYLWVIGGPEFKELDKLAELVRRDGDLTVYRRRR